MSTLVKIRSEVRDSSVPGLHADAILARQHLNQIELGTEPTFVVIDRRPLIGQCFLASLRDARPNLAFKGFPSVAAWQDMAASTSTSTVLLCLPGGSTLQAERDQIARELAEIHAYAPSVRVAVMSDYESPDQIVQVLKLGVKGYIPTSISLEVAIQALHLVRAGGVYMPAACMMGLLAGMESTTDQVPEEHVFSPRQLSVARALRKGTPNKIIAYELNMCESTVKVHVRNIMKKLKAKNRTEVAYLTNQYFSKER
ncbi:LuxR C-terminal-related transcriptional regulator [Methylobacterium sp. E-066]|uniref:LuxR C-terminal-related transcriptional regulator n=1 Tax=Methylobacterium sp. E-066 TaxID=2836584 RepID=UPI001FB8AE05|nr:response regulator transcription factor [Methylobacterium sp. E-066]MCJ2141552.1 response regulator transcription factor [Methylobacterium sp. E-066]